MTRKTSNFIASGNTVLDAEPIRQSKPVFTAFSTTEPCNPAPNYKSMGLSLILKRIRDGIVNAVLSSEMACSLKIEDYHGVSYGHMSHSGIAALSVGCSVIGVLAIVAGA